MEEECIQLLTISIDDFSKEALTEAIIRIGGDDEDNVTYCIDTLWWYLYQIKIPETSRSKFHHLFKVEKLLLSVIHSNTVEETLFSRVRKNLTQYRASPSFDGSLSSIIKFQMNQPTNETCYECSPSDSVLKKARTATMEYNKKHSRTKELSKWRHRKD